jgi:hypothetical protein
MTTMNIENAPSINNDDYTMKPVRKRLRSSEPDLKISVGTNDETVEYWYHSSVMATHSNYIDTMLATPMQESKTLELSFPDLAPATWDSMMKFLEGPVEGRLMKAQDVMDVAHAYDQYDFPKGRELCGHVLTEYFKTMNTRTDINLEFLIDAVLLADALTLVEAKTAGVDWLAETLKSTEILRGQTIFSEDHMKKLVPLIVKEELLFQIIKYRCWIGVETKEDVLSHLFPRLIVQGFKSKHMLSTLGSMCPRITLSGTSLCNADGIFEQQSVYRWEYSSSNPTGLWLFQITLEEDGWTISGDSGPNMNEGLLENINEGLFDDTITDKILWKCPHSQNLPLPPKVGWQPVHRLARGGSPKLTY